MIHSEIVSGVNKFRSMYGVPPNEITVGSDIAHELRQFAKYTMIFKPIKIDERGNLTLNTIPINVNYEYPDMIEISLKMKLEV